MLHFDLLTDPPVLVLTPLGTLEARDFDLVAREVDPFIARHGKLAGLLIHARSFPGWADFAALVGHLRFVRDHEREIERIAVATDGAVVSHLPALARHFVAAEVRHFAFDDKDQALAWIASRA